MGTTTQGSWNADATPRGDRPRDCQGADRLQPLVAALKAHPGLDAAERCLALHALKQVLCWDTCLIVCDRWTQELAGLPRRK